MIILFLLVSGCTQKTVQTEEPEETKKEYVTVNREIEAVGDIPVEHLYVAHESPRRPGEIREIRYITIHETDNRRLTADAHAHLNMLITNTDDITSWHYTVDDHSIVHHIPDNEVAWNAGDNRSRDGGNINGIGNEMCVNLDNDYEQTLRNTAALTAALLVTYELEPDAVHKHQDYMEKICPHRLLTEGRWDEFTELVEDEYLRLTETEG